MKSVLNEMSQSFRCLVYMEYDYPTDRKKKVILHLVLTTLYFLLDKVTDSIQHRITGYKGSRS